MTTSPEPTTVTSDDRPSSDSPTGATSPSRSHAASLPRPESVGTRAQTDVIDRAAPSGPFVLVVEPVHAPPLRCPLPELGSIVIGGAWSSPDAGSPAEVRVDVDDSTVSARHARIELDGACARIVDLGSRNGTWIGGARVSAADLAVGGCAILGRSVVTLESVAHDRADEAACDAPRAAAPHEPIPANDAQGGQLLPGAIGRAPSMRRLARAVRRFAPLSGPVLVRGESGSGKELVARALHSLSARRTGPFQALNLGALPRELAEAELFGYERGAFTGATVARAGVFELAHGGTLLLDELGELPLDMQAKLLRVLETREVRRLGAKAPRPVDVRVVAATWAHLEARIAEGSFREDLFHRIAVLVVDVPPLRDRAADIPAIARALLEGWNDELGVRVLAPAAVSRLAAEQWPGNVRELRNVLYRAAAHARGDVIELDDVARALSPGARATDAPRAPRAIRASHNALVSPLRDATTALGVVKAHGGSITAAARACGIPRETLRDWVHAARRQSSSDR